MILSLTWFVLGAVALGIAFLILLLVLRMAAEQDREARDAEKQLDPFSDVPITRWRPR